MSLKLNLNNFLRCSLRVVFVFSIIAIISCKKDPIIENEEELITSLIYELIPRDGSASIVFKFSDLDGDGPARPILETGPLKPNTVYDGTLILLNQISNPVINITDEVADEAEDHQFFFVSTPDDLLKIEYNDQDKNGNPLGISTILTTGGSKSGTLTITLRHKPLKTAAGVAVGKIDNAAGETDIEVKFPVLF